MPRTLYAILAYKLCQKLSFLSPSPSAAASTSLFSLPFPTPFKRWLVVVRTRDSYPPLLCQTPGLSSCLLLLLLFIFIFFSPSLPNTLSGHDDSRYVLRTLAHSRSTVIGRARHKIMQTTASSLVSLVCLSLSPSSQCCCCVFCEGGKEKKESENKEK